MDLFLVLIVVNCFMTLYHCAKKFWWGVEEAQRRPSRNWRRHAVSTGQAAMYQGVDQAILESLPVVGFSSQVFKDGLQCSVCLSEVVDGEKTRLLPKCSHGFHVDCIDTWFQSHSTCPLCRNNVVSSPLGLSELQATINIATLTNYAPVLHESGGPSHMVIDIPVEIVAEIFSSEGRCSGDEAKSPPVLTRMLTFTRFLSK